MEMIFYYDIQQLSELKMYSPSMFCPIINTNTLTKFNNSKNYLSSLEKKSMI